MIVLVLDEMDRRLRCWDQISQAVHNTYCGATREEVIFLIKLCEICRKAHSKSKGPLKPITYLNNFSVRTNRLNRHTI